MGADAFLFCFDHTKYCTEIVPAFLTLLREGDVPTWLAEMHQRRQESLTGHVPMLQDRLRFRGGLDLQAHCTLLDSEFGARAGANLGSLYESRWSDRACTRMNCPEQTQCPFFYLPDGNGTAEAERFTTLFELAVAQRCLGPRQFLGRSIDAFWYWDLLYTLGVPRDGPVRQLLTFLARRGYVVGYRWTLGTEGIHGWLSRDEAAELADQLFALPLPNYDQTFAAMEHLCGMDNLLRDYPWAPAFNGLWFKHPTASFEQLSLSFVRTVCRLASRDGQGVLWGNGVYPVQYEPSSVLWAPYA